MADKLGTYTPTLYMSAAVMFAAVLIPLPILCGKARRGQAINTVEVIEL